MTFHYKKQKEALPFLILDIMRNYEESLFNEGEDPDEVAEQMLCYQSSGIFIQKAQIEQTFSESLMEYSPTITSHPANLSTTSSSHPYATSRFSQMCSAVLKKLADFLDFAF